jgi:UDP:flavonoid glycosyltransferase YjiC (YdhE family)
MAIGSRGDVQPLVALGAGLQQKGHQVNIVAGNEFDRLVKKTNLNFIPLGINIQEVMEAHTNIFHFIKDIKETILKASNIDQDAIISTFLGVSTCPIARAKKIPFFYVLPMPSLQTREFPNPLFPRLPLGKIYNELTYRIADGFITRSYKDASCLLEEPRPIYLFCFSPHVVPRPYDWGDFAHVTGYWFLDQPNDWQPLSNLEAFLQAGPPPVYVGFGSTLTKDTKTMTKLVLDALALAKQRAVLVTGWGGLKTGKVQPDVFVADSIPFDWLFPRVKAAIHHGGAGTTSAALRAAIPSVIVPFGADQSFWAHRMKALGVATDPISPKRLTAKRLAAAIQNALEDKQMQENANALGEKINSEDGIRNAITIIERVMAEKR